MLDVQLSKKMVAVVLGGFLVGASAAYVADTGVFDGVPAEQEPEHIRFAVGDGDRSWLDEAGVAWTVEGSSFDADNFQVGLYGRWSVPAWQTIATWRSRQIDVPERTRLQRLEARGRLGGSGFAEQLQLTIWHCTDDPINTVQDFKASCREQGKNVWEKTVRGDNARDVVIGENLSTIVNGSLIVWTSISVNTSQPVPADQTTYWDSLLLTGENIP